MYGRVEAIVEMSLFFPCGFRDKSIQVRCERKVPRWYKQVVLMGGRLVGELIAKMNFKEV